MNIKELLRVKEDYEVPNALMETLKDREKRLNLFQQFSDQDLSEDFFREYYETNQADRKNFMQDFTPACIGKLVAEIEGTGDTVTDVCSGTGVSVYKYF